MRSARLRNALRIAVVIVCAALTFLPMYWVIVGSLTPPDKLLSTSLSSIIPTAPTLEHYRMVLFKLNFKTYTINSLIVAVTTTVVSLVLSALGGYALARLKFPGRRAVGNLVLFTYIIPTVLLVVPIFSIIVMLDLQNTRTGLILTYLTFTLPFCLWMMKGFFAGLPPQLEEAAQVDGATRVQAMLRVVFPLTLPGLVATAMFSFMLAWNEYLFALVFLNNDDLRTIPIGVTASLVGPNMEAFHWAGLMAASVLSSIPVFIIFIGLQRYLIQGMAAGAMKG